MGHIEQVIHEAGGVSALAFALGIKPPTVSQWRHGKRPVPPKYAIEIARRWHWLATVHDLRPDVFGPVPQQETGSA